MLSVIIPVYNEMENIKELVKRIEKTLLNEEYEIIFIDDSIDNTTEVIKSIAIEDKKVKFSHRETKNGLSSAVVEGFKISNGDIVAVMDGDLQHPPEILSDMINAIHRGADVVVPSRFIPGGDDGGLNLFRKLVSAGARYMAKILLKKIRNFSDPTSGIFMLKKQIINEKKLCTVGWKILLEILVIGEYNNPVEIPYKFCNRNSGKSKMSLKVQMDYIVHLLSLISRSREDKRFYSFCAVGLIGVFIDMSVFALIGVILPAIYVKVAAVISAVIAVVSNYILNNSITWGDKLKNQMQLTNKFFGMKFIKYVMVSLIGILMKFIILLIFYNMFGLNKYIGNFIGILCSSFSNYYMSKFYVFEINRFKNVEDYYKSL
ncbi:glycosyltransferase family 2 protein [Clostridium sp. JS66]|uniref:glycosyltransferase family 2 protein n=1 Tax=Clostridium sp. JS66 TaxID=3064705 RepID=UPI00298EB585|nr:glycosyltransferase family 2 protein [Clostridium sp. JS66]WPC43604.1 glycosyltransferase family 2 protein [Clostridium sp. JS66]